MASNLMKVVLLEFDTASLSGSFQNFGAALTGPALKIQFYNTSTVQVYITDGTSNWRIPASGSFMLEESRQDDRVSAPKYVCANAAQLQVKQVTAAAAGAVIAHVVIER